MTWTHLEVVPEDVVRQTVVNLMVSTEGLPALTSKTKCVDHTCSQFTCQHVITVEKQRRNFMDDDEKRKERGAVGSVPTSHSHPLPVSSEFGGVLSMSQMFCRSSGAQFLSSRPSSQSWSPLHTSD